MSVQVEAAWPLARTSLVDGVMERVARGLDRRPAMREASVGLSIGIDVGGTFTDICVWDEERDEAVTKILKVPSTYPDPSQGIFAGIRRLGLGAGERLARVVQGSTIATNAMLERTGRRSGMLVTQGFRDLIEIGRQTRSELYDLQMEKPEPVVPRWLRFEVPERMAADGRVLVPLDEGKARELMLDLRDAGVESLSICLLHSYRYPEHELRLAEIANEVIPEVYVSISHKVDGEFREFERFNTTAINAYLGPVIRKYVEGVDAFMASEGQGAPTFYTQSNGGLLPPEAAIELPSRLLFSGPAAGVGGAAHIAASEGVEHAISLDMGGTSTDVCVIKNGEPHIRHERRIDGLAFRMPAYDIETVGAGGGSIAHVDEDGLLKVGPRSAGSVPGPAAYGRGGDAATVTDAHVVIGTILPEHPLSGDLTIDIDRAREVVGRLARQLDMSVEETALGIIRIAVAKMVRAVRMVTVRKGEDPRDFALIPFGGAGPMHACWLAGELGTERVLVPAAPGVLSAYGQQVADLRFEVSRSDVLAVERMESAASRAAVVMAGLECTASEWAARMGLADALLELSWSVDMRLRQQNHELTVPWDVRGHRDVDARSLAALVRRFQLAHEQAYGHVDSEEQVSLVTYRLTVTRRRSRKPRLQTPPQRRPPTARDRRGLPGRWPRLGGVSGRRPRRHRPGR